MNRALDSTSAMRETTSAGTAAVLAAGTAAVPGKRKIDRALICAIHQDYSDGMGYGELSKKYGFSRSSIHDAFQRFALPTALIRVDPLDKRMTTDVVARVTALYQSGHTLEQVSQTFLGSFTPRDIKRILQKHNVKRRVRSDYETMEQIDRRKYHPVIIGLYVNDHLPVTVIAARLGLPETYCRRTLQRSGVKMRNRNDYDPKTYKHEARAFAKSQALLPAGARKPNGTAANGKLHTKQPLIATHKITAPSVMPPLAAAHNASATSAMQQRNAQQQNAQQRNAQQRNAQQHISQHTAAAPKSIAPARLSDRTTQENPHHQPHPYSKPSSTPISMSSTHKQSRQTQLSQTQPSQTQSRHELPVSKNAPQVPQSPAPAPRQFVERDPERGTRLVSTFDNDHTDAKWELVKSTVSFPTNDNAGKQATPTRFISRKRKSDSFD